VGNRGKTSPTGFTDSELLRRISRSGDGGANYKQLTRELGLGGGRERRLLLEQLAKMTARGALEKPDRDHWTIPAAHRSEKEQVTGRLDVHRDGFGFVRIEGKRTASDSDVFIPPDAMHGAMQGDQVLVSLDPPKADGRRSGRVLRILTRRNPTVVGIFHSARGGHAAQQRRTGDAHAPWQRLQGNYVTPLDERMTQPILIPPGAEIPQARPDTTPHRVLGDEAHARDHDWKELDGLAVDVEITDWPTPSRPARGRVIEVLGHQDDFGVDVEIVIRKHHLPHTFPDDVLAEARALRPADEKTRMQRRDFRALPIVTIDGETARDFDDAVLAEEYADGTWTLQVHIADVAHYVTPGSALDREGRFRGTSVYFPDRAIPMLPSELSTDLCSLRPDEDRLVLSCVMHLDTAGALLDYELCEGVIRSARRMTYTQVAAILDNDEATRAEFSDLVPKFESMYKLARVLNTKRVKRGSIDFDLPEPVIQFDPEGNMRAVVRSQRNWAHRLIEEFMLAANECVAAHLEQLVPSIYRIHEKPEAKRVMEFEEVAAGFGYTLGVGNLPVRKFEMKSERRQFQQRGGRGPKPRAHEVVEEIDIKPQMYQRLAAKLSGKPEERILSYLMLRSLKQARYSDVNEGHFALAAPSYTHFTSPIRRYPDLIIHRILKAVLAEGAPATGSDLQHRRLHIGQIAPPVGETELALIAQESSQSERRADDAERELIDWKKMKFMQDRVGDEFRGLILSVTKYGLFVELEDIFIEGLVPITSLTGDYFVFRENTRQIVGERSGRRYAIGDHVEVILDRVDRVQRRMQFALVEDTGRISAKETGEPLRRPKKAASKKSKKTRLRDKKAKKKKKGS
jgi:ribonuclease R